MENLYVNISFDDLHPRKYWGLEDDFAIQSLLSLREEFSEIKYTFFTIPKAEFELEPKWKLFLKRKLHQIGIKNKLTAFTKTKEDYNIVHHQDWFNFVKKYIGEDIFEIGLHGLTHYSPFLVQTAEFMNIGEEETKNKIRESENILFSLTFTRAFRPPGWGNNIFLNALLKDLKFKYLSLDPKLQTLSLSQGIFYIPQQYSIENKNLKVIFGDKNYLFIKGHMNNYSENGISEETINNLKNILRELKSKYIINFIFLRDIEDLYKEGKLQGISEL